MPRCAEYLTNTINLQIFNTLCENGLVAFLKEVGNTTLNDGTILVGFIKNLKTFHAASIIMFLVILVLIVVLSIVHMIRIKRWKDEKIIIGVMAILMSICIVWALVLFYTEEQVSRHIMSLIVALQMLLVMHFTPKSKVVVVGFAVVFGLIGWQYRGDVNTFKLQQEGGKGSIITEDAKLLEGAFEVAEGGSAYDNTVLYV